MIGDITLLFHTNTAELPSRQPNVKWVLKDQTHSWQLILQNCSEAWHGFPFEEAHLGSWDFYLLGELYNVKGGLADVLNKYPNSPIQTAAVLNGHFLLFAFDRSRKTWEVLTDRFGTVHAYYAVDVAGGAAVGTFFPAVAAAGSRRKLDWAGLASFFSFGFFAQDRTFFEDVRILKPASRYLFDEQGRLLSEERYWQWYHKPDMRRTYDDTVAEFAETWHQVMAELTEEGRVAFPISGGLDSRSTVAALPVRAGMNNESRFWSYSYGYSEDFNRNGAISQSCRSSPAAFSIIHHRPLPLRPT